MEKPNEEECRLIRERIQKIVELYKTRVTQEEIAKCYGMKKEEVAKVLSSSGYWHGVDRCVEPNSNYQIPVVSFYKEFQFLLKYPI